MLTFNIWKSWYVDVRITWLYPGDLWFDLESSEYEGENGDNYVTLLCSDTSHLFLEASSKDRFILTKLSSFVLLNAVVGI